MPTKRLSDYDRQEIVSAISNLIDRPFYAVKLDIDPLEQYQFLFEMLPADIGEAYMKMYHFNVESVRSTKEPKVFVYTTDPLAAPDEKHVPGRYAVELRVPQPLPQYFQWHITKAQHGEFHRKLEEWCHAKAQLRFMEGRAYRYADKCIGKCTSAGQVKRVLPGIEMYMPHGVKQSLQEAERRSRIPQGLNIDHERRQELMVMLARGHLCPSLDWRERQAEPELSSWMKVAP